jgi:hypothetical protein
MNHLVGLGRLEEAKKDYALLQRISPGYVRTRLEGKSFASFKRPEDGNRSFSFWRLVAGLDDSPT